MEEPNKVTAKIQPGDTAKIHYRGRLKDGTVFESTQGGRPLLLTIGEKQTSPAFEQAVLEMKPGEKKNLVIPAAKAYGPYRPGWVMIVNRSQLPRDMRPAVGQELQVQTQDGRAVNARITQVSDDSVTMDGNHPLAGQDLIYDIHFLGVSNVRTLTYSQFKALSEKDAYYEADRWDYFQKVIEIIHHLPIKTVLELGPYKRTIVEGADAMDVVDALPNLTYCHNAAETPWPISDDRYDLFIALQVWEHLRGKQKEAFQEVQRIAKMAILSFPLNWDCPGNCHHGITEETIAEWTLNTPPMEKILVGIRIIYCFRFR
ncbi:MAG: peptidylprolyl isomerase [Candidatus Omnitrophota bacterium]